MENRNEEKEKRNLIMKSTLARFWMVFGILSVICAALCSLVSIYAVSNLLVFLCGVYAFHLARKRRDQIMENKETIQKMTRKQREQYLKADTKEASSIASLSKMMPYLIFGVLGLNAYTYYYNFEAGKQFGLFAGMPQWADLCLLCAAILLGLLFYIGWAFRMSQLLHLEDELELPQKKSMLQPKKSR